MNRGNLLGLGAELAWRNYDPKLAGFVAPAHTAPTQPAVGGTATAQGRFVKTASGLVVCQGRIVFDSNSTFGSGDDVWGVSLPFPANRSSGGADEPLGVGWAWQGTGAAPQLSMQLVPTLMDALQFGGQQSNEDYYLQLFNPYLLSTGTGAFTSGSTTVTVTHGLGHTPAAYDILVVPTNSPSTAPGEIYVDTIGSSSFAVHVRSSATTTPVTFAWKVRAEPNSSASFDLLVNSLRPWAWASGHQLSWHVTYEARR